MKNIIKTNYWFIGITVLLYFTFWGGILFQILIGIFHLVIFSIMLSKWKTISKTSKFHLKVYGVITSILILLTLIFPETFVGILWIGSLGLVVYFTIILMKLKTLIL